MVVYGRFRVVPTVRKGKVAFNVVARVNIGIFGKRDKFITSFSSKGKAALHAIKLDNLEKKAKQLGVTGVIKGKKAIRFAKKADKFLRELDKPQKRKKPKRRKK